MRRPRSQTGADREMGLDARATPTLAAVRRRLRALGDPLHGLRDRLAGALMVASVGGLALTAATIPMVGVSEPVVADSTPWMLATLVAAFTTLFGYARGAIALARVFWREARA